MRVLDGRRGYKTGGKRLRGKRRVLVHPACENIGQTTAVSMKFRPGTALNCYGNFAPYLNSARLPTTRYLPTSRSRKPNLGNNLHPESKVRV